LQSKRERDIWSDERLAAKAEKRAEFELATLLAVQDAMLAVSRSSAQETYLNVMHMRTGLRMSERPPTPAA
jgi:hypothetical protein